MTTIENIGQFTIAQHGHAFVVIDRRPGEHRHEVFHDQNAAHDHVIEQLDLVEIFETVGC